MLKKINENNLSLKVTGTYYKASIMKQYGICAWKDKRQEEMFTMTFKTQEFDFPSLELFLGQKMKLENKLYT